MSLAWLKANVLVGSVGKLLAASLFIATFGITGCGDDPVKAGVAKGCTLNSDCDNGLVCSFGLCHQDCKETSDCPKGQRCLKTAEANVCQLDNEAECHFRSDCEKPLFCAIDLKCRNQCQADEDCLKGQKCADGSCAEPDEINDMGGLKDPKPYEGEGGEGNLPGGGSGGKGGTGNMVDAGGEGGTPPVECVPGVDCEPEGQPCQRGQITCSGSVATCEVTGDADDGIECGTDQVCSAGECVGCKAGDSCDLAGNDGCLKGEISCATGPSCEAAGNVKNGTGCGTDMVCSGGTCVACKAGDTCEPTGLPCRNGVVACGNGPTCSPTTNKSAGDSCGTDKVCDSGGTCKACVQDGACEVTGLECHIGRQDCTTGPNCTDSGQAAPDGISCTGPGSYNFCTAGSCEACSPGNPCIPANPCHKGTLNCSTNPPTCNDTAANAVDGLACGTNKSCISGQCLTNDRTLSITSGAVADVAIDAPFAPVSVHLVDSNNVAVQGAAITVAASPGAYALASAVTNAQGNAQVTGRVGRAIGSYKFTVSAPGATPVEFSAKAIAANAKDVFTLVNTAHVSGVSSVPGAGTLSKLYYDVRAVASAKDGTLYVASYCAVYKLSIAGELTLFAGSANENCGSSGDSGLATQALVSNVAGLALDETNGYLYLADYGNSKIRQIDLSSNQILTYAGGGVNQNPYGDGGPADAAYISPTNVAVAPNGDVYISDAGTDRIRKVDATTGIISTVFASVSCSTTNPLSFNQCLGAGDACSFAWDSQGQLFISAYLCGDGMSGFRGVARVAPDKSLTLVAGTTGSANPAEGGTATSAAFSTTPYLAFDKAGNLFITTRNDHRVRRIDALTTKITTVAGTGTAGQNGDYIAGNTAQVNDPTGLAIDDAGNLYFADASNYQLRTVYGVGTATASSATLATTGGTGQSVKRDAPFAALTVKLTDASNAVINGVNVSWKRLETGSGLGSAGAIAAQTKTNASGTSAMTGRVGLASGDYHFEASYADIHGKAVTGSPQAFTVTATDPAAGEIFAVANYVHVSGTGGYPGPTSYASLQSYSLGVVAASDGTFYFTDQCAVYKSTSRGEASVFAGTIGNCALSGDSGPAVGAKLYYPESMALDESRGVLYIADNGNSRIRMVSLSTGVIDTFAGGDASVTTAPWGDGGPAVNSNLGTVTGVSLDANGLVYIPDYTHNRIRVVNPDTGVITSWLVGNTTCVAGTVQLYSVDQYSAVRFKSDGTAFIGANFCQGINTSASLGIARRDTDGTMTRIAGLATGSSTSEDIDATQANFPDFSDLVIDGSGNLVVSLFSNHRVRYINLTTGKIKTLAGDGTAGYALPTDVSPDPGAYVAASGVRLYYPFKLGIWLGHVMIADEYTYSVRMIW
jgi:sugar lactone lactonase YvrE